VKQKNNSNKTKPLPGNAQPESDRLKRLDLLLLLGWLTVAIILRFYNLGDKSPASIEIATVGFSLGHGFSQIPINQIIPSATLLTPLQFDSAVTSANVVTRLLTESTHPPLYFLLTHWWLKLFLHDGELVSLSIARSLSAILGGLAIPAIFGLSWVTFRDRLTAHLTAVLMAISPYGIYLAQEARHYTISVLWIIVSLTCWTIAINSIRARRKLTWGVGVAWMLVNSIAIATHYFFSLVLAVEAAILVGLWWQQSRSQDRKQLQSNHWWRIVLVVLGTLAAGLVWFPVASNISSNELTSWIDTDYSLNLILLPILRMWVWLIAMVVLLPVEGVPAVVSIIFGSIIVLNLIWLIPGLIRGWRFLVQANHFKTIILSSYCLGAIILCFLIIYGSGKDISLAARYHFIYFPAVIVLLGAILAQLWQNSVSKAIGDRQVRQNNRFGWFAVSHKQVVIVILVMGLFGSLTVANNWGFQKSRQSNLLAQRILDTATPDLPTLIATSYTTHSELRESIALALSLATNSSSTIATPQFFLLGESDEDPNGYGKFQDLILSQPKPFDLWAVNLKINSVFISKDLNCKSNQESELSDAGYKNLLYHCQGLE